MRPVRNKENGRLAVNSNEKKTVKGRASAAEVDPLTKPGALAAVDKRHLFDFILDQG
jgi:hypothetical protein